MILTVTANSALDRLLFIDEFRPGTTIRPFKTADYVGGKGFDTSVVLQALGVENRAVGFVAGPTGQALTKLLDGYGIIHDLIWVEGDTRIAHIVIEARHHRHSHLIAAGLSVSAEAYQDLLKRYRVYLAQAAWVVAGGSLARGVPVGCYRQLTAIAHEAGVPVLIDSFGPPLLETFAAPPTVVKMNWHEFGETFGPQTKILADLAAAAQKVRARAQISTLIITCGEDGILALTPAGSYLAAAPPQTAVNAAGAGDAVSAALAWRLAAGDNWPEALRWAAATGAAVTLTEGTADCHMADVERIRLQTKVQSLKFSVQVKA
ncbi:MAG: hexose kinase [Anaerolineae bacterium]|nr:hexose kinase [Anaerolineae bacterium]